VTDEPWRRKEKIPGRILLINGNYADGSVGGTQTFTENLARWLTDDGYTVAVLCHHEERPKVERMDGVTIYRIRYPRIRGGWEPAPFRYVNTLLAIHNPLIARPVASVLRAFRPDLCHVQMLRRFTPAAVAACTSHRIPVVQTVHEELSMWRFNPFKGEAPGVAEPTRSHVLEACKKLHRKISARVDAVCAPSTFTLDMYKSDGYFRGVPAHVIPNAVPREWGDPRQVAKRRQAELANAGRSAPTRFLLIGRLESYKGVVQVLAATELLARSGTNIKLSVAGTGSLEDLVRERAAQDNRITFHGAVGGQARARLFAAADVLLCPSTWMEAFALVVSEAQAAALPCIVSGAGALPSRVEHGRTGFVVGPTAPAREIADTMLSLCDPVRRSAMSAAAAHAAARYGPCEFLDRQTNVYRFALSRRKEKECRRQ
jgi:glycosyltransferase involved in cell wall biosynthesis